MEYPPTGLEFLPLVSYVEPELVTMLCKRAAMSRLIKTGQALFEQGDPSEVLFVVRQGSFKSVWTNRHGKEVILQIIGKGEFLGVNSLTEMQRHLTSAIALEDARVCVLTRDKMESAIREYPHIALQVICNLGHRLNDLSQQVTEFRVGNTQDRVLNLLKRLAREHGETDRRGIRIKIRLTQQDIADFVGASRVMVAQALKKLSLANQVARDQHHFIIITAVNHNYEMLNQ